MPDLKGQPPEEFHKPFSPGKKPSTASLVEGVAVNASLSAG